MFILFPTGGRTGNHLFQTSYAASLARPNEYILTRGFGKTRSFLRGKWKRRWLNIDAKLPCWFIERFIEPLCWQLLIKTGLVSSVIERGGETLAVRTGKIRRITIVKGYFESDSFMASRIHEDFRLKSRYVSLARARLAKMPEGATPLFIHLRRGDLASISINGYGIQLPDAYYWQAVELLKRKYHDPFFVIVGDDPAYAETLFAGLSEKYISRLSAPEDLALMSLCSGGILSNSTFAWWGAFMGKPGGYYIAPRYWSGWPWGTWYPAGMNTALVSEYLDVRACLVKA
jgi:hypothetical protein